MSKLLIIPDVHGRTFWKYAKDNKDEFDKIIFLGDYLDPYPHEGITFNDSVNNFKEIIQFKKDNDDKVILHRGNHDEHYYKLDFMNCSRLNAERRKEMHKLYIESGISFNLAYKYEQYLFSHAGVYKKWLEKYGLSLSDVLNDNVPDIALESVSDYRGGYDEVGSCIWADIRESQFDDPIEGYIQIVGHTQLSYSLVSHKNIICLDCRKVFILDTETEFIYSPTDRN